MGSPEEAPAAAPEQPESEGAEKAEPSKAEPGSLGADDDGGGYEDGDEEGKEGAAPEPEPSPEEQGEKLLAAAKAGDAEETARLVLEGIAPLQHVDRGGWTPLLWAACNGHAGCVATLVEAGAASTAPSTELGGATAVSDPEGDADKASPNTSAEASSSPVRSRAAAAKMIVNSPLHWAAFKGHTSIVFKLLLHGMPHADIDAEGNTALHLSAAGGEPASAICLLNHGSDLFAKNFFVNTPMDLGTKSAIRKTLATLAVEKTYEMGTTIDRKKPGKQVLKNGPMQWEGMRVQKVAYPTTRILCTGVWCRETNGDALPPANLCSICMEQINQSELALRAGMENKAKEPMAAQIATLERAIEAARKLGSSAAVIAEAETALSRVRAEKALTDYSVEVEATRPIGDTAYLRRLQELLHDAERQLAGRELTQAATALLHSAEAEEALTRCVAVFEGMELCVEMASRADINRLKAAMATSQRDAGHEAQLAAAKKLLKRLLVEARIGQLLTTPENVIEIEMVKVGKKKKQRDEEQEKIVGYIHATLDATKEGERFDSLLASLHNRVELLESSLKESADDTSAGEADPVNEALLARAAETLETLKSELGAEVEIDEARKAAEAIAAEKAAKKAAKKKKK